LEETTMRKNAKRIGLGIVGADVARIGICDKNP